MAPTAVADEVVRRIAGLAVVVLLVAVGWLSIRAADGRGAGYELTAVLGDAGSGLRSGSDVKIRGILVGQVIDLRYTEGRAVATLEIDPDVRIPHGVDVVVTAKTLLGPKQIELHPPGPLVPPYLDPGETIAAAPGHRPTEVQDVADDLTAFLRAIDPDDLAVLVDAVGTLTVADAEAIAANIDHAAQLSAFAARTADAQVDRIGALADLLDTLASATDDFTRLNRTLPGWTSLLPERHDDVRQTIDGLAGFSVGLAELLEVHEESLGEIILLGDRIGAVVEPRVQEIGDLIYGVYRYSLMFGQHGGSLSDGSEHAHFRIHVGQEGMIGELCRELPEPLVPLIPLCVVEQGAR